MVASCENSWPSGAIHGHSRSGNGRRRGPSERQSRRSQAYDLRVCGGQGRGRTADLPIFRTSKGVREACPGTDSCSVQGRWVLLCPPVARLVLANPLARRSSGSSEVTTKGTPVDALMVSERGSACRRLWRTRPERPVPPVHARRLRAGGPLSVAPRRLRRARPCVGVHV